MTIFAQTCHGFLTGFEIFENFVKICHFRILFATFFMYQGLHMIKKDEFCNKNMSKYWKGILFQHKFSFLLKPVMDSWQVLIYFFILITTFSNAPKMGQFNAGMHPSYHKEQLLRLGFLNLSVFYRFLWQKFQKSRNLSWIHDRFWDIFSFWLQLFQMPL